MPTPRDALRRQVHDVVHRHLIRPAGGFRAHELVDDLVDELDPLLAALVELRAKVTRVEGLLDGAEVWHARHALPLFNGYVRPADIEVRTLRRALDGSAESQAERVRRALAEREAPCS